MAFYTKKVTRATKENLLTRQSSLFKRERRGDSPSFIANRLTCQRTLCNRRERQGDSPRVTVTDLDHGSSTMVQNRVQCKENSTRSYENLSRSKLIKTAINTAITVKLLKSKVTLNTYENLNTTHETERDQMLMRLVILKHVTILVQRQRNKTLLHYQNATTHMQV